MYYLIKPQKYELSALITIFILGWEIETQRG